MTSEMWRPIVGFGGAYEVSNLGRVRSLDRVIIDAAGRRQPLRGQMLRPFPVRSGHLRVSLAGRPWFVHTLVLEAFVGPCPPGLEACHGPGGVSDNRPSNLRWDTQSANKLDRRRDGTDHNVNKTCCPRQHRLIAPNLRPAALRAGRRGCLACSRASTYLRDHPTADMQETSDRYYTEIMAPAEEAS